MLRTGLPLVGRSGPTRSVRQLTTAWERPLTGDECSTSLRTGLPWDREADTCQKWLQGPGRGPPRDPIGGNRYSAVNRVPKEKVLTWNSQLRRYLPSQEGKHHLSSPKGHALMSFWKRKWETWNQTSSGLKPKWLPVLERTEIWV